MEEAESILSSRNLDMTPTLVSLPILFLRTSEFEVAEDATKTQIKSAFVKSLKTKKMNKKILGEFVELVLDKYFYSNR